MIDIYHSNCIDLMALLPNDHVDLTVTSPPYDGLRIYNGYTFDFESVACEIFRITKPGGVVVWVVGDETINGDESGTSFHQALYFKECGFNLHDTMIFEKAGTGAAGSKYAYRQSFEYMFILSKGKPKSINLIRDHANVRAGTISTKGRIRKDGSERETTRRIVPEFSVRSNVWRYAVGNNGDDKIDHPARFPEWLARDHIISWSNVGDLVFDPFLGSGTTAKAANQLLRRFIGCDISAEYVSLAKQRVGS